jgi:hypothetical protein
MVSEDSDQLVARLSPIHRFRNSGDLGKTVGCQMTPAVHHPHALRELLEVRSLRRSKRVRLKERDDRRDEVMPPIDDELGHVLSVIVVSRIRIDPADAEERS